MADETGVTVLLTDGSEEHFEQAVTWTPTVDGGVKLIAHDNGDNQHLVAEYMPGRAVRVCNGPPFRVVPEGNAGPDDEKAAIYEAGFRAGQEALAQAVEAQAQGPREHPPEAGSGQKVGWPEPQRAGPEEDAPAVRVPVEEDDALPQQPQEA